MMSFSLLIIAVAVVFLVFLVVMLAVAIIAVRLTGKRVQTPPATSDSAPCPACRSTVSLEAKSCPNCGHRFLR